MATRNRPFRTRYRIERECELDMRVLVRDWRVMRELETKIQKNVNKKRLFRPVDEIDQTRLLRKKAHLVPKVETRFEALYQRMTRIRDKQAEIANITTAGGRTDGVAANS